MQNQNWQKPLISGLTEIKRSLVGGRYGVFAKTAIKKGQIIEEYPGILVPKKIVEESILINYAFDTDDDKFCHLFFGSGSLFNHAENFNAGYGYDAEREVMIVTAMRNIAPGEEIYFHYGDNWFADRNIMMRTIKPKEPQKALFGIAYLGEIIFAILVAISIYFMIKSFFA